MESAGVNKKRLVIRIVLLLMLVAFGFLLFYIGKEHELLLDNKSVAIGGKSYAAAEFMRITINGDEKKTIELYANERDIAKVSGPRHTIKVEIVNEDTEEIIKSVERSLNFGTMPSLMISLPALAGEASDVYLPLPREFNAEEEEEAATKEEKIETGVPVLSD